MFCGREERVAKVIGRNSWCYSAFDCQTCRDCWKCLEHINV